jgi:DNA polymerase-1
MTFWTCVFDIETCSASELHRRHDFTRLYGYTDQAGGTHTTADVHQLLQHIESAPSLAGFNVLQYDLLALAKWYRDITWYERMAAKTWDSFLVERHLTPVAARGIQPNGFYSLNGTCARYGLEGKTDDIKSLARKHGGFDKIPLDDPDYHAYLHGDVAASVALLRAQQQAVAALSQADRQYIRREHRVQAALTASISLNGFPVDMDLTMRRYAEGQDRLQAGRERLHHQYGMPLEGKAPHRTLVGKAAFRRAILATGISEEALDANWPLAKDGSLLTGKDTLTPLVELFDKTNPAAAELCRVILAMNGERTVAGTMLDHAVNGRVHPGVSADQNSGRWSITDPGLTVLGKRGGKHVERAMLTAEPGEVLVAIDADQVDARVVAAECQDPDYMKLFEPGRDLHSEVAWLVWPSPGEHGPDCTTLPVKCKCPKRDSAKASGHGFSYGLGARGMSIQQGVPVEACQRFIDGFTQAFPRLARWKAEVRAQAGALGFDDVAPVGDEYRVLHTWAGRPVRIERNRAYTQATAGLGQGGTRDVMAHALLSLPVEVRRRVKAVIHDEFVFSLPADRAESMAASIAEAMSFDLKGVAITFGVSKPSFAWSGCYEK